MEQLRRTPTFQREQDLHELPVSELLKKLSHEMALLVRQELELAKVEISQKGKQAGKGVGMFGAAGMAGMLALGALTACIIAALSLAMAVWLAALIVAIVYGIVAFVLAQVGKAKLKEAAPPVPVQTIETLKEDVQWAKTQTRSARR